MANIDAVWARIEGCAGQTFHQIRGGEFIYIVRGNSVIPDRTSYPIHRSQFEKALAHVPLESTVPVQHLRGPSYIYAVLMDQRIRDGDW